MSSFDYRCCDKCGVKAFYDANLNYRHKDEMEADDVPTRWAGEPSEGPCLDYLGDWAVLCSDCAKTYKAVIVPIKAREAGR